LTGGIKTLISTSSYWRIFSLHQERWFSRTENPVESAQLFLHEMTIGASFSMGNCALFTRLPRSGAHSSTLIKTHM
jgi:hypothetical protein